MLRVLIYDKLDDQGRAITGERRAIAAFSDETAQQQFIQDAKLEPERIKFDFFEGTIEELPETAQPEHICYALYKKWSQGGPFQLSGYAYTKTFPDVTGGYDQFVMPVLINKTHAESEAWKDAAIQARLGSGRAYREAKKALEKLPEQEREKREAEFLVDFAQNAYRTIKPKTARETRAVQAAIAIAIIWAILMFLFVPIRPSAGENLRSVSWLPRATDVSYFRSQEMVIFECRIPWQQAQTLVPAEMRPARDTEFTRYTLYRPGPNASPEQSLAMTPEEFEQWNSRHTVTVRQGYLAELDDGSRFLYDSVSGTLYGLAYGDTRKNF